jgi:hypothetical protein
MFQILTVKSAWCVTPYWLVLMDWKGVALANRLFPDRPSLRHRRRESAMKLS